MTLEEIAVDKGALCATILRTLPTWFGMPESNAAYERDVEDMPMFAAVDDGAAWGFLALRRQTPHAAEIHVMAVRPEYHRRGTGRALVARAEDWCRAAGMRFLTVKTLSARDPDPGYAGTRAFYESVGFVAIEEFPELWSPDNPAVMMLKPVA